MSLPCERPQSRRRTASAHRDHPMCDMGQLTQSHRWGEIRRQSGISGLCESLGIHRMLQGPPGHTKASCPTSKKETALKRRMIRRKGTIEYRDVVVRESPAAHQGGRRRVHENKRSKRESNCGRPSRY